MPGDLMKTSKDSKKLHHHHLPTPTYGYSSSSWKEKVVVGRYKECRKNHAASIGGYAVDGCLEFMPTGQEGSAAAFKCAACGCHRNFHRRETDNDNCNCDCSSISTPPK